MNDAPRSETPHDADREGQLWLDCYNANPQSMLASLNTFLDCGLEGALVLGSIGELGAQSSELHYMLGCQVAEKIPDQTYIFTVGDDALHLQRGLRDCGVSEECLGHFLSTEMELLAERLKEINPPALLIKGSRSVKLERLAPLLEARAPSHYPSTISPSR